MLNNTLVLAIDFQNDFMEGGNLGVKGSLNDVNNFTNFINNNFNKIDKIMASLDTHMPLQIFHSIWWIDKNNNHPAPFTTIKYEDIVNGTYMPLCEHEKSINYVKNLELNSKKNLIIWPYHCIDGTNGVELNEKVATTFDTYKETIKIEKITKGLTPYTEMYGILKEEYNPSDYIQNHTYCMIRKIKEYDTIVVAGEAADYCVFESVKQICELIKDKEPELGCDIIILKDCMSAISDKSIEEIFEPLKKYDLKIVNSTEINL